MSQIIKITARDLIRKSLTTLGVLGMGDNPSEQEANDALFVLNEIVDKWNIEKLMITNSVDITFNNTGNKIYTIGPMGDIDVPRPPSGIDDAYYIMTQSGKEISLPLKQITQVQYNSLTIKDLNVIVPQYYFYNASYPLAQLYLYPLTNQGKTVLTVSDQFTKFNNLDSLIDLPIAYITALRYTLTVMLAKDYGRAIDEDMKQLAAGAKATIKAINSSIKKEIMRVDGALLSKSGNNFNIYSGD